MIGWVVVGGRALIELCRRPFEGLLPHKPKRMPVEYTFEYQHRNDPKPGSTIYTLNPDGTKTYWK